MKKVTVFYFVVVATLLSTGCEKQESEFDKFTEFKNSLDQYVQHSQTKESLPVELQQIRLIKNAFEILFNDSDCQYVITGIYEAGKVTPNPILVETCGDNSKDRRGEVVKTFKHTNKSICDVSSSEEDVLSCLAKVNSKNNAYSIRMDASVNNLNGN